jgi:excisionase family DNA binding protein
METSVLLHLSLDDLRNEIRQILNEALNQHNYKEPHPPLETGDINLAIEVLNRSKSWIYKATCQNIIPYKKFGSKIVFNRSDLEAWMGERTIDPENLLNQVDLMLKQSAEKKLKYR